MSDIEKAAAIFNIATPVVWVFLAMSAFVTAYKIVQAFAKIVCSIMEKCGKSVKWFKSKDNDTKRVDILESEFEKAKQEFTGAMERLREDTTTRLETFENETKKALDAAREVDLVTCWEKIISMGMEAIAQGHISYSNKALFDRTYNAYHGVNGNGHVTKFKENDVDVLPFTEEISEERKRALALTASARITKAQLDLSSYYVINGIE